MIAKTALVLFAACGLTAFAVGCGGEISPAPAVGSEEAHLRRMKSCGELLTELKSDAKYKLDLGIDHQIDSIRRFGAEGIYYGGYGGVGFGDARGSAESNGTPTAPAPSAGAPGSGGTTSAPKAQDHSETTSQVAGVDEADFVKADNQNIYLLHGTDLKVLRAWPKESLAEIGHAEVEGTPMEMFLEGQSLVVYSQVNGAKLFQATGTPMRQTYGDYAYGGGGAVPVGAPDVASPPYPGGGGTGTPEPYYPLTKVTVFQLAGNTPQATRELYFEGNYEDSRRVGTHVRTVLNGGAHGPTLDGKLPLAQGEAWPTDPNVLIAKLEQLRAKNRAAIDASVVTDWLPVQFERKGTAVSVSTPQCEDTYVPTMGSTTYGLTQVETIDLAAPQAPVKSAAITGSTRVVYGNADKLVLAQDAWVDLPWGDLYATWRAASPVASSGTGSAETGSSSAGSSGATPAPDAPVPTPTPKPAQGGNVRIATSPANTATALPARFLTNRTHVHELSFAQDASFPIYVGSASVGGSVDDQYSIDEFQGNLRIATTESFVYTTPGQTEAERLAQPQTENHVRVLGAPDAQERLPLRGDTGVLAAGERIYSARFMGGKGYLVTFRQVDPLFALDLSNPANPHVTGELKIPGFSEFMVPMDDNHLLTIGRDATTSGQVRGLSLQIFDVTNPAQPVQAHKATYASSDWGYSEALYDPKAFTYFKERGLVAFPYYASNQSGMRSSLEVFRVDVNTGFTKAGSIDHSSFFQNQPNGYSCGYYGPSVRRGVFLEDVVYSISYGGVIAKQVGNLSSPGQVLPLSQPTSPYGYSCGVETPATPGTGSGTDPDRGI